MAEKPYANREIDSKFSEVHGRFDTQDKVLSEIVGLQKFTNGKVKKIIIVLCVMGGFLLGLMGKDMLPTLIKLFI